MALTEDELRGSAQNDQDMRLYTPGPLTYLKFNGGNKELGAIEAKLDDRDPKYLVDRRSFCGIPSPVKKIELIHRGQPVSADVRGRALITRLPESEKHRGSFNGVKTYCELGDAVFKLTDTGITDEQAERSYLKIIRNLHLFTTGKHKNYQITLNTAIGGLQLSTHPISYETKGVVRGLNPLHTIAIWERFRGRGSKRLIGPLTLLDGMGDVITQKCPYRD
ncbi:hypothetical protein HN747_02620 [archaeon]|jgi:hypothetical protein|nr:hypothetical protein [archaeon]